MPLKAGQEKIHSKIFSYADFVLNFVETMQHHGLQTKDPVLPDGYLHRFHVHGDKPNTKNGWYILYGSEPYSGVFGCHKRGISVKWRYQDHVPLSEKQQFLLNKRIEQDRLAREAEFQRKQAAVAQTAVAIWEAAQRIDIHPYATQKGITLTGLRVARWSQRDIDNALLIPLVNEDSEIVNLQAIFPVVHDVLGRNKDFLFGGRKKGCWHMIGTPQEKQPLILCEGYATGASIHEATGYGVAVAFDAGNLVPVAKALRKQFPLSPFMIAADNDPVGIEYAETAKTAVKAKVIICPLEEKGSDFNDLAKKEGLEAVKQAFEQKRLQEKMAFKKSTGLDLDTIDTYSPLIDVTAKGRPKATIRNLEEIMRRTGISARYNMMSKRPEITVPNCDYGSRDNALNDAFGIISDLCSAFDYPLSVYKERLSNIANAQEYHPIREWILSKPWDGINRTDLLFETITLADEAKKSLSDMLFHRWLTSAVAAIFEPRGIAAQGLLTFVGAQGVGKTSWFKALVPEEFEAVKDGLPLDPRNKDDVMRALRFWITELGELDGTFRKADIAALKAFITEKTDILRLPYAPQESTFARRTVFCGSVNNENYLQDPTGNRRFWTIAVKGLNAFHALDMQQIWAEVYAGYLAGDRWWLDAEEMASLNTSNDEYKAINPLHELIEISFDWQSSNRLQHMTPTEIVRACGFDRPTKIDTNEVASYMRKLNCVFKSHPKTKIKGFLMPPRRSI